MPELRCPACPLYLLHEVPWLCSAGLADSNQTRSGFYFIVCRQSSRIRGQESQKSRVWSRSANIFGLLLNLKVWRRLVFILRNRNAWGMTVWVDEYPLCGWTDSGLRRANVVINQLMVPGRRRAGTAVLVYSLHCRPRHQSVVCCCPAGPHCSAHSNDSAVTAPDKHEQEEARTAAQDGRGTRLRHKWCQDGVTRWDKDCLNQLDPIVAAFSHLVVAF